MEDDYKEVRFDLYCRFCKYYNREERMDPCNECLESGMNQNSSKPVFFKERGDNDD